MSNTDDNGTDKRMTVYWCKGCKDYVRVEYDYGLIGKRTMDCPNCNNTFESGSDHDAYYRTARSEHDRYR